MKVVGIYTFFGSEEPKRAMMMAYSMRLSVGVTCCTYSATC